LIAQINRPAAINISGIVDWSTELVFTDAFKQSRTWISHQAAPGGDWDSGVPIPLGPEGYPLEIPYDDGVNPPQGIRALMLTDLQANYPGGSYRLIAEGEGQIRLWGEASGTFTCPVDTLVVVDQLVQGTLALEIERSEAGNPVRNIRFIYPEYVDVYESQTFTTEFLNFIDGFQAVRFMDWSKTNFSPVTTWNDRSEYNYYTQTQESGIAWEYIIELCNLMQKDAWICIPHLADDNFIDQLATLFRDNLDPDLKIYLEYSNEVWNGAFQQNHDAADLAAQLGYTGQPWELSWKYTAKRSADLFYIFENVFGGSDRLVKVIPSQAANPWLSNQIVTYFKDPTYNPNQVTADALAIAPYFGGNVANNIIDQGRLAAITIPEIIEAMDSSLQTVFDWMDETKVVADDHNLDLISYEGGQHLVATGANVNIDDLTQKLIATNRHEGMYDLYCKYFDYWYETVGGGLFAVFSSHGTPSKWGSWGIKEHMLDTLNHKYLAVQECVQSYNSTPVSTGERQENDTFKVFPNPSFDGHVLIEHSLENPKLVVFDVNGKLVPFSYASLSSNQVALQIHKNGMFFLTLTAGDKFVVQKIWVQEN
ncbi:MAG: T9SS type A sorting domain-containing protein, partial [Saprospiraceae bacterium]|nr:T9SS type A sorting domain-containing protein [Saprospiraceae bacterium]